MLGVIVTVGVLALLASTAATLSNMLIKRAAPSHSLEIELDTLPINDACRLAGFARAATLFHRQSQLLWAAFVILLSIRLLKGAGVISL